MARNGYDILAATCAGLGGLIYLTGSFLLQAVSSAVDPGWSVQALWLALVAMVGPALSSLIFFPALARKSGLGGVVRDLIIMAVAILIAVIVSGTLAAPGLGTVMAPIVTFMLLEENPLRGLVFVLGTLIAMGLARRKRVDRA